MFWLLIAILIVQRAAEMAVARQNEQKVKKQGAIEFGESTIRISLRCISFFSCP